MHIYDKDFTQTELPMTKQEIRAISIAKLMLKPNSILIDVGAGTGTIGIEAATYMSQGKVYAIEKEEKEGGSALERFKATGEEYVLKLLNQHKSLVILMDKSQGTNHENAKQVFIKILENHIKRQVQKKGIIVEEEILIHILASNFTESLLEIARHYENPDWAKKMLNLVTKCYYEGVNSI